MCCLIKRKYFFSFFDVVLDHTFHVFWLIILSRPNQTTLLSSKSWYGTCWYDLSSHQFLSIKPNVLDLDPDLQLFRQCCGSEISCYFKIDTNQLKFLNESSSRSDYTRGPKTDQKLYLIPCWYFGIRSRIQVLVIIWVLK